MNGPDPFFEALTGLVHVPLPGPDELKEAGLSEFYRNPNDIRWGRTLCRVLFHESLHLWQILSSGYLANILGEEWARLLSFEKTGELRPFSRLTLGHWEAGEQPFSPAELSECLVRYWDVHTRGPHTIILDEGLAPPPEVAITIKDPFTGVPAYTGGAYDYLMQHGREASDYEHPYRWLLERSAGDSGFVALTFPILAYSAFGTPDPVGAFCAAFDRARQSEVLQLGLATNRTGNINFDWLNHWAAIIGEGLVPVASERMLPAFTGGLDVIHRGPLRTHPVYANYLAASQVLLGRARLMRARLGNEVPNDMPGRLQFAKADLAARDPWVIFGLPGQPEYRALLGAVLPPPRVVFSNFSRTSRRIRLLGSESSDEMFAPGLDALIPRVTRFRNAEYAANIGLPATSFEIASL